MPNRGDRNWIRFCAAVDGFRLRYGRWPTRVWLFPAALEDIRDHILPPAAYERVACQVRLVPEADAPMIAEDDLGGRYDYGKEGFPSADPDIRAHAWFGDPKLNPDLGW